MPWYITDGILKKADSAPAPHSILTDITGEGKVIIPPGVIGIADNAFFHCARLISITLPEGMTHIGASAFSWCNNLTRIVIPHSVTHIGAGAFNECSALQSITIPNGITAIEDLTFSRCSCLKRISIPSGVKRIRENAFSWCLELRSLSIPDSVTEIGAGAFEECIRLSDLSLPNNIKDIEPYTFSSCSSLIDITLPESIASIGAKAFRRCLSLESITIPQGVAAISENAFYGCISLTNVTIPGSVATIGESSFVSCRSLKSIIIPNSVSRLEKDAFTLCHNLTSIFLPGNLMSALDKQLRNQLTEVRCTANVGKVPPALRPTVFATFARHESEYSPELRREHIAAIKRNAAKLTGAVCTCPELLHLMCREKLIGAKDIDAFAEESMRRENTEVTAVLLDYQTNVLTMEAVFKARELKEKALEKQEDLIIARIEARADKVGIDGLNFVVTGKLNHFKNRDDIKAYITSRGGKLLSSMSAKADYLITNDTDTGSAKNVKAAELGITVISEDEFIKLAEKMKQI